MDRDGERHKNYVFYSYFKTTIFLLSRLWNVRLKLARYVVINFFFNNKNRYGWIVHVLVENLSILIIEFLYD